MLLSLPIKVQKFNDTLDERNDGFALGLQQLDQLKMESAVLEQKLEFARFGLEDAEKKSKKAVDMYEDVGLHMCKSNANLKVVR